jgi:hypothetical protein
MKPIFTDRDGYVQWIKNWKVVYNDLSTQIRTDKTAIAKLQSEGNPKASAIQRELVFKRVMARKMLTLLEEARIRRDRILDMHKQLAEQNALFPMHIAECRNIDFYFNKASLEFEFLPRWSLKCKGKTFYINHLEANIPWSTKEIPDGPTKGLIRLRNGDITIDASGTATINPKAKAILQVA